jgi:hypothetical protein
VSGEARGIRIYLEVDGIPDPTMGVPESRYCRAMSSPTGGGFACTQARGHEGCHIAGAKGRVGGYLSATWPLGEPIR